MNGHIKKIMLVLALFLALQMLVGTMTASAAPPASGGFWHTVRWGETLFSIGRLYGVNPWAIARANCLPNPNRIYAGQTLWIPYYAPWPQPWPGYCRAYHWVKPGDNLFRIARWYGVSPWAIAQANGIYNMNLIYSGTSLCIP
ncbi:MAG: LysM peptidoglycan-binding domain-containing protein [Anaerolineae bacterium]